jgi:murein L,D-transpeptidase YafK
MVFWSKVVAVCAAAVLAGGAAVAEGVPKELAPIPAPTLALMKARGTTPAAPILIRTFKKEAELEVWKKGRDGRFALLKSFPICRWSGQLGPKRRQGDRQAPEGFYSVTPKQMNPNSAYHLSFDLGFPNAYDRAHGATGAYLMVHGVCSSAGCYAMTDAQIEEIYAIAREAFAGGQEAFQVQAFPFRMTAQNMARHRLDPNIDFWRQLKEGSDRFEAIGEEPTVGVAGGRYVFRPSADPAKEALAAARLSAEQARIAALSAESAVVRTTYADGGQHPVFAALMRKGSGALGLISRPEALAFAGREIVLVKARAKPLTQVAVAQALTAPPQSAASAPAPAGAEPSVFAAVALAPAAPMPVTLAMTGSARILPTAFVKSRVEVAARW